MTIEEVLKECTVLVADDELNDLGILWDLFFADSNDLESDFLKVMAWIEKQEYPNCFYHRILHAVPVDARVNFVDQISEAIMASEGLKEFSYQAGSWVLALTQKGFSEKAVDFFERSYNLTSAKLYLLYARTQALEALGKINSLEIPDKGLEEKLNYHSLLGIQAENWAYTDKMAAAKLLIRNQLRLRQNFNQEELLKINREALQNFESSELHQHYRNCKNELSLKSFQLRTVIRFYCKSDYVRAFDVYAEDEMQMMDYILELEPRSAQIKDYDIRRIDILEDCDDLTCFNGVISRSHPRPAS